MMGPMRQPCLPPTTEETVMSTPKTQPKPAADTEPHTELRPLGKGRPDKDKPHTPSPLDAVPNPVSDDTLDDLFNDMPV